MWSNVIFGSLLIAGSAGLLLWHVRSRPRGHPMPREERTYRYLQRRYRRRVVASGCMGLVGIAILGGIGLQGQWLLIVYWGAVAMLVLAMMLLAVADLMSSTSHFRHLLKEQQAEKAELLAQLDQLRRHRGNGRPDRKSSSAGDPLEDDS